MEMTVVRSLHCDGPGCQATTASEQVPNGWIEVSSPGTPASHFCSLAHLVAWAQDLSPIVQEAPRPSNKTTSAAVPQHVDRHEGLSAAVVLAAEFAPNEMPESALHSARARALELPSQALHLLAWVVGYYREQRTMPYASDVARLRGMGIVAARQQMDRLRRYGLLTLDAPTELAKEVLTETAGAA